MARSVNDRLQDETIAHGLYVTRYGTGVARRMVALLSKMDADLAARLMVLLDGKRADTYSARRLHHCWLVCATSTNRLMNRLTLRWRAS